MITNDTARAALAAPVRTIGAHVAHYHGQTLVNTYSQDDRLQKLEVSRAAAGRFFGFGLGARLHLNLIDLDKDVTVQAGDRFTVTYTIGGVSVIPYPDFYATETNRNEKNNALSITAYDLLNDANSVTVQAVEIETPYTLGDFAEAAAAVMGLDCDLDTNAAYAWELEYTDGANLAGDEQLREVLDDIAEASQTIYYINNGETLVFKALRPDDESVYSITKAGYFELSAKTNRRLAGLASVTELGDNYEAHTVAEGTTEYFRNNAFLEMRSDIGTVLDDALFYCGGLTVAQFTCSWRGCYLLEPGDKLAITTKEGDTIYSYFLDDTTTYSGGLEQSTTWEYQDTDETETNPTSLQDALYKTFARVDKANNQVDIVASHADGLAADIAGLHLNTQSINASVEALRAQTEANQSSTAETIADIQTRVNVAMTAEQVDLKVQQGLAGGVSSVQTETGFTFDSIGLTVARTDSEMVTVITEDGMSIARAGNEVLRADNEGVKAEDLHATTYLIIGNNSRFEDYDKDGESRTGCFWIGGVI